jgi:isoleucyl-tRNA synthetase
MDAFELDAACREVPEFLDKLTNFYIRRSRRRFWKSEADADKDAAFATLYEILLTLARLVAPIMPFVAEMIFQNLRHQTDPVSVHHADFPAFAATADDSALRQEITLARDIISLTHAIRARQKIRVRQPLALLQVALPPQIAPGLLTANREMILEEVNVKALQIVSDPALLGTRFGKPDARKLGPKFGKEVQEIIREAKAGNFTENESGVLVATKWQLQADEIEIGFLGKEGTDVESARGIVVALQTEITPQLKDEGIAREIIRHLQDMRKEADYEIADRIAVAIGGLSAVVAAHGSMIAEEVLAIGISAEVPDADLKKTVEIDGEQAQLAIKRLPENRQ